MKFARHTLTVGQDEIAYIDHGQGPVLVCLHAIAHSADDYRAMIPSACDAFRCVAIDFPGHGESGPGSRPASADYYADVVQALLAQLGISQFILMGNSIGGAAAIILAARLPEQVKALVLCNPGGIFERSMLTRMGATFFSGLFAQGEKRARWFQPFYALYYRLVLPTPVARQRRDEITAEAYQRAQVNREAWQSFAAPDSDLRAVIRGLQLPIFMAWARGDKVNRLKLNLPTIRALKRVDVKTYPAGHIAFLECPEEFERDFQEFVRAQKLYA